jgi:hypothetical protein
MGTIGDFDLKNIRRNTGIGTFIETGTLYGHGILEAHRAGFYDIHSIEIEPTLAKKAKEKFADYPYVSIYEGNSFNVLEEILPTINRDAFFWLDAHFPGADAHLISYEECKNIEYDTNLPLEREIDLISKRIGKYNDIIVSDDLWLYEDIKIKGVGFNEHCKMNNHNVTREEIVKGKDLSFLYDKFKDTHDFQKVYKHQGYLVTKPKAFKNESSK